MTRFERLFVIGCVLCCPANALQAQPADVELVCLQFPVYEDGSDSLYYGDYYAHSNPCSTDLSPRYKWFTSNTQVPQGCPFCCDPNLTCIADEISDKAPTPKQEDQDEDEGKGKKARKAGVGKKEAAGNAEQKLVAKTCGKLSEPVDVNFNYQRDARIGARKARKKDGNPTTDSWAPKNHIKVISTNWALVKFTIKGKEQTMPVKVYVLELKLETANRDLNELPEQKEVVKFKKNSQIIRVGFEAKDLPDYLKGIKDFPTCKPAVVDDTCKTTFTINVDTETDSYFVTSAQPVFD